MEKQKFKNRNNLAEEALLELRQRITEVNPANFDIANKGDILKIFQVEGEPNWGERKIIVTKRKKILANVLAGQRELHSLTNSEWSDLLNPSPPNKLVYHYFKVLHKSYKTKAFARDKYYSAFSEILQFLKEMWEANPFNRNIEHKEN